MEMSASFISELNLQMILEGWMREVRSRKKMQELNIWLVAMRKQTWKKRMEQPMKQTTRRFTVSIILVKYDYKKE